MQRNLYKNRILTTAIVLGFIISFLSLLENRTGFEWVSTLCGFAGGGCKDAAAYSVMGMGLGFWGLIYYFALTLASRLSPSLLFWSVWAGWGMEASLVAIMVRDRLVCPLCLVNLAVMAVLGALVLNRRRIWQATTLVLLGYCLSESVIAGGTGSVPGSPDHTQSRQILATVADHNIFAREIEGPLASRIYTLEKQIHQLKANALDSRINDLLLKEEAKRKSTTVDNLKKEITREIQPPSDADVDRYYQTKQYRRWGIAEDQEDRVKEKIRNLVFSSFKQKAVNDHCLELRTLIPVETFLEEPRVAISRIPEGDSPAQGPEDAPVTVIEFSDYLCPSCRSAHKVVQKIRETYQDKIRWVFKDFPLNIHPGADTLAVAARCAKDQGNFWAFQDLLFSGKEAFEAAKDDKKLTALAQQFGLDPEPFDRCIQDPSQLEKLNRDILSARKSGISMTPTFIINGKLYPGMMDESAFSQAIDQALLESDPS